MSTGSASSASESSVIAMLGPTNTGKTHYAIERMLGHTSGIIGLPLRLLAREVYDTVVTMRGSGAVALITGEEKIQPRRPQYFICTVEAMPLDRNVEFVAIDEVQMCADPERGHIFTDRLLHARGRYETLLLGSDAARQRIASLVPKARFIGRERFSTLAYSGTKKLSRLKPRAAVVAFSVDQVYAIAELIRRQRGGAAVVMGALSPRTRNAQVALYQQGDVDYLVATDAIGMGLNLDIDHVAFAGTVKFDGRRQRQLEANELAQIAGRAGRYTRDGTFGVTGEARPPAPEIVDAIEAHRFKPVRRLNWRNPNLSFASVPHLIRSLETAPGSPDLARAREADDLISLRRLWEDGEIRDKACRPDHVRLLWEVCQIPDFRKITSSEHTSLLKRIFGFLLSGPGVIPSDWIARQVQRIDRSEGDIDALSKRIAFIRTWTYVAHRSGWIEDADHWAETTRAIEDRLSDALHARLTQRFVDRRTSVLMRRLKQKERLVAEVNDKGEVTVEGEYLGRIDGFRFQADETASAEEMRTLRSASLAALQAELARRADKLYLSPDAEIEVTDQGGLVWGSDAIGRLEKGDSLLAPRVRAFVDEHAEPIVAEKVERRLSHWLQRRIKARFEPLIALRDDDAVTGLARGVAFRLIERLGVIPRNQIAQDIKALGQDERAMLRKHGVRFGQYHIFMPLLLKPAPTGMRLLLWSLWEGFDEFAVAPPPGQVTIPAIQGAPQGYYERAGYRLCGSRALRIDMLERLADMVRPLDAKAGFEATADMLSITGCTLEQFAELMAGLGYRAERGERAKPARRPAGEQDRRGAGDEAAPSPEEGSPDPARAVEPEECSSDGATKPTSPSSSEAGGGFAAEVPAPAARAEPDGATQAAPVPEKTGKASEAPEPSVAPAKQSAASSETETFFVFRLPPRQTQGSRRHRQTAAPAGKSAHRSQPGKSAHTAPARGGGAESQPPRARAEGRGASKGAGESASKAKPDKAKPPAKRRGPAGRGDDRSGDPNSPFAILAKLKNK